MNEAIQRGSRPRAWIINIGTELVIGLVVNTNGAWLARELSSRGVEVERIVVVGDQEEEVVPVLREALASADIVLTTGGLGPTHDDKTMEFLSKALGLPLELNREALSMVERRYREWGLELTPPRIKMAFMPRGAVPIPNPLGAAPGAMIRYRGKLIFALPGVPKEMEAMFQEFVVKELKSLAFHLRSAKARMLIAGLRESDIALILSEVASKHPNCYVKSHPHGRDSVRIEVVALASSTMEAEKVLEEVLEELKSKLESLAGDAQVGIERI